MFSYKKRIFTPLVIVATLLCLAMAWVFIAMYQLVFYSEQKDMVDRQRYDIVALEKAITNAESGQRGYLLTGHTLFLDSMEQGRKEAKQIMTRFDQHATSLVALSGALKQINQLVHQKFDSMDHDIQVQLVAGSYASHLSLSKDRGHMLMAQVKALLIQADEKLVQLRTQDERHIRKRMLATVIGAIVTGVLMIGILLFSYRSTTLLIEQVIKNKAAADQLMHVAEHDLLTDLPNRRSIEIHLEQIQHYASRHSKPFAIFFMDLDGFKLVNDQYGHAIGDALLLQVSTLFKKVLRQSDFLARQGGDEFVLIVSDYMHRAELIQLAQRLINLFKQPMIVKNVAVQIGVSIGIAEYPHHGVEGKALLLEADEAMYTSKKNGKNRYSFAMQTQQASGNDSND